MHCRSCEILIEERLRELPGVKSVQISYKKSQAVIHANGEIDEELIRSAILAAGYVVGLDDAKNIVTTDPFIWKDFSIALTSVLILYFLARALGLFNISVGDGGKPSNLAVVLLVGLTAGFSTCMALVGGLILGTSAKFAEKHPEATPAQKFRPHLFFNLGRITSYAVLGGVIGLLGTVFQLSGATLGILIIVVGVVMLVVGLQLTELFPVLSGISVSMPAGISKIFGIKNQHTKEYSHTNSMITGALTFFLPCGFTQAMMLYAMSTGSFTHGALIMGIFALGTTPGLLGIGGLTSVVKGAFGRRFFKGAGLIVAALAVFNISNGLNLTGFSNILATTEPKSAQADKNVTEEDGVQIVKMNQLSNGYSPNTFTIKANMPVRWVITSKDPASCAASLYSQKLNIRQILKRGENIVEFTPTEVGKVAFSCSMGMYRGSFNVVANSNGTSSGSDSKNVSTSTNTETTPASSDTQIIKTTYTLREDIIPSEFSVKVGLPVRFEIDPKDDGQGCMSSITIPGLTDDYEIMEKGQKIVFEFTPKKVGQYEITCAMGVPRGTITVTS